MKEKYLTDLQEIKVIMSRASRFISLSGLSGVSTGIIALAGVLLAYLIVFKDQNYLVYHAVELKSGHLAKLFFLATGTLILSVVSAVFFTQRKTKKQNEKVWDAQTVRLLVNLLIPLITGGLLSLLFVFKGYIGFAPSMTLIFYGLALVNGSKYTFNEIRTLGIIEILLGLLSFLFIAYSLIFWAIGFGVVQLIYGLVIQRKY